MRGFARIAVAMLLVLAVLGVALHAPAHCHGDHDHHAVPDDGGDCSLCVLGMATVVPVPPDAVVPDPYGPDAGPLPWPALPVLAPALRHRPQSARAPPFLG